jgi:hypothetical protein
LVDTGAHAKCNANTDHVSRKQRPPTAFDAVSLRDARLILIEVVLDPVGSDPLAALDRP